MQGKISSTIISTRPVRRINGSRTSVTKNYLRNPPIPFDLISSLWCFPLRCRTEASICDWAKVAIDVYVGTLLCKCRGMLRVSISETNMFSTTQNISIWRWLTYRLRGQWAETSTWPCDTYGPRLTCEWANLAGKKVPASEIIIKPCWSSGCACSTILWQCRHDKL